MQGVSKTIFCLFSAFCLLLCPPAKAFTHADNGRTTGHLKSTPPGIMLYSLFQFVTFYLYGYDLCTARAVYTYQPLYLYYICIYTSVVSVQYNNIIICVAQCIIMCIIWFATANDIMLYNMLLSCCLFAIYLLFPARQSRIMPGYPHPNRISFSAHYAAIVFGF